VLQAGAGEAGDGPLLIGGKSMGGRVAAMVAADPTAARLASAVVCLGYPFHPPGKPDRTRLEPLQGAGRPILICQGDRDPFGSASDISGYELPDTVSIVYLEDGDHDFKPRGHSPATWKANLDSTAKSVCSFAGKV
jgi:hypothetical protein